MDKLRSILTDLDTRLKNIEKGIIIKILTIPSDDSGAFVPKVVATDPATPKTNEVWINSATNQLKWNDSGTIKAVTLS